MTDRIPYEPVTAERGERGYVAAKLALLGVSPPPLTAAERRALGDEYRRKYGRESRLLAYPEPGYWALRLAKGGIEVGACIRWEHTTFEPAHPTNLMPERSPFLAAYIDGHAVALDEVWHRRGRTIDRAEYDFLVADRRWARTYRPRMPEAHPYDRVDLRTAPPALPTRRG